MILHANDEIDVVIQCDNSTRLSDIELEGDVEAFLAGLCQHVSGCIQDVVEDGEVTMQFFDEGEFGVIQRVPSPEDRPHYSGPYSAKPTFDNQTYHTANKVMDNNFEVQKIEVARVSNPSGGRTVYIGGEYA